jgi:hypothetical protein
LSACGAVQIEVAVAGDLAVAAADGEVAEGDLRLSLCSCTEPASVTNVPAAIDVTDSCVVQVAPVGVSE